MRRLKACYMPKDKMDKSTIPEWEKKREWKSWYYWLAEVCDVKSGKEGFGVTIVTA